MSKAGIATERKKSCQFNVHQLKNFILICCQLTFPFSDVLDNKLKVIYIVLHTHDTTTQFGIKDTAFNVRS